MDTHKEKIGPIAILETKEGLRVAVYAIRTLAIRQTHFSPPVKTLIRVDLETDGGQYVLANDCNPHLATVYGRLEPILCSIVIGDLQKLENIAIDD